MAINSWKNLVESVNIPVLTRGGPSSSETLNNINNNIRNDLLNLSNEMQDLDRSQQLLSAYLAGQSAGFQAMVNNMLTLIPAAPYGRGVANFYSSNYLDGSNTAYIDTIFGEATLPILSVQEKMSSTDGDGNVWIPADASIRSYVSGTYVAGSIPSIDLFDSNVEDWKGVGPQPNTFFLGGELLSPQYLYLMITVPQGLNTSTLSNQALFYPVPCGMHTLVAAYYQTLDGSWNSIDISYMANYVNGAVPFLGPVKLHFPPSQITSICVVLYANGWWGVQQTGVELVTYANSATLAVNMSAYSPTAITQVIVGGQNPNVLNSFSQTISGNVVSVLLSQMSANTSPVVTSIDARWN